MFKALSDDARGDRQPARPASSAACATSRARSISQPTVSHHLRILRDAGLVEAERRGTFAYYWLVPQAIERLAGVFAGSDARLDQQVA